MKNYKIGFLALSILSVMPLVMADTVQDLRIKVTTFADENGENLAACSLREALKAAELNQPYGGCSGGQVRQSMTDVIVLDKGEYRLNSPLEPASQVVISGFDHKDWGKKDPITGTYPANAQPISILKGNQTFSLIDTSAGKGDLSINDVVLQEGGGQLGGAIHAGTAIKLTNVLIRDSKVTEKGGAIYLSGSKSGLVTEKTIFEDNQAPIGAVLAMTCLDNLKFTERTITLGSTSILNNGNNTTKTVIEFCGNPKVDIINNTMTKNIANTVSGSILKFTGESKPNTTMSSILSNNSGLSLQNNTIIDNTAHSIFLYDSIGQKSLTNNIIGYNKQGYSCRHWLGTLTDEEKKNTKLTFSGNAFNKNKASSDYCDVPYSENANKAEDPQGTVDLSKFNQQDLLFPLQMRSDLSPLPVYFLKNTANNPLVNNNQATSCIGNDQLGRVRNALYSILIDEQEGCDVGAIERSYLIGTDVSGTNDSLIDLIKSFEKERDFFKDLINDRNTRSEFLPYYKIRYQEQLDKIENYPKTFKYRASYFDVFALAKPHELMNRDGAAEIQHLDKLLYSVTTESLGTGPDVISIKNPKALPTIKNPNLKCEWDESISRVVMYRTDGIISQAGDYDYCKYTISLKSDPSVKTTALLQVSFKNINPVAQNDRYTFKWGTDQRVRINLLANDHDNGDGKPEDPFYPKDKKTFYVDKSGVSAPIKIKEIDSSLHFEAEYQAPCPDETGDICYGGDMYVQPKNSFNKFNYSFTYAVFDADGGLSNEALVEFINTATTTDDTRGPTESPSYNTGKPSSGGSIGLFTLFSLIGLVTLRRKYIK